MSLGRGYGDENGVYHDHSFTLLAAMQARQAVMLDQKRAGYTLDEIGRFWGFDRSSVSNVCTTT